MGRYDGKTVVITGGSSGFGFTTAKLLVDGGARVLITGRTQATLDSARERLGENAVAVRSDVASLPDLDALADRVKVEFGTLDALFANAGVTRSVPFESMSEEVYDELFTINAKGSYWPLVVGATAFCRPDVGEGENRRPGRSRRRIISSATTRLGIQHRNGTT